MPSMPHHTASTAPARAAHVALTEHARKRMSQRGIGRTDLAAVLRLGRCRHARGARFFIVGRKEVERCARQGIDIRHLQNLQVLLAPERDEVLTVYRNARLPRC